MMLQEIKSIVKTRQECEKVILQANIRKENYRVTTEKIYRLLTYGKLQGSVTPKRRHLTYTNQEALRMMREQSVLNEINPPKNAKDVNQLPLSDAEKWQLYTEIQRIR